MAYIPPSDPSFSTPPTVDAKYQFGMLAVNPPQSRIGRRSVKTQTLCCNLFLHAFVAAGVAQVDVCFICPGCNVSSSSLLTSQCVISSGFNKRNLISGRTRFRWRVFSPLHKMMSLHNQTCLPTVNGSIWTYFCAANTTLETIDPGLTSSVCHS